MINEEQHWKIACSSEEQMGEREFFFPEKVFPEAAQLLAKKKLQTFLICIPVPKIQQCKIVKK